MDGRPLVGGPAMPPVPVPVPLVPVPLVAQVSPVPQVRAAAGSGRGCARAAGSWTGGRSWTGDMVAPQ
ncbi:hypothetical protein GFH48_24655 [Streptomyces fagopyri]|uniref:Uncharacterized protein n=1 Tax=Streptomyces fagopyri TaxID=2662397 RepID=A0A5Q0LHM3_9ACTN|nr:hypothetical protein [Streptomyces fagopyri]QFZ76027.1 hypothetical protein GFH48_24655 [Streptomyces fagopyri]